MKTIEKYIKDLNLDTLDLNPINIQNYSSSKSYLCALSKNNLFLMYIGKSRFLSKNALFVISLQENILEKNNLNKNIKTYFFIHNSFCSKAKQLLIDKGIDFHAFM